MERKKTLFLGLLCGLVFMAQSISAYQLPDTGLDKCYNDSEEIPCPSPGQPFYGQDAQYTGPQPAYGDNGDGTVTDLNTELMWQQGDSQNATATLRTWQDALDYCATLTLANSSDWYLPNRRDLLSIILFNRYNPGIDTSHFPEFQTYCDWDCEYWSNIPYAGNPDQAWPVQFRDGTSNFRDKTQKKHVRCVRRGPVPGNAFRDNGNGTVSDDLTGLVWQKDDSHNATRRTWEQALNYCETLTLANRSDWRVPNIRELESIVALTRSFQSIDPTYFPDCLEDAYWSSTTLVDEPNKAWQVYFGQGTVSTLMKGMPRPVRCVRGGLGTSMEHYVESSKTCGGLTPCYDNIQSALDAAMDGDMILVAQGAYVGAVWAKAGLVTLSGGWNGSFTAKTGTTEMRSLGTTGGGSVKVLPETRIQPPVAP